MPECTPGVLMELAKCFNGLSVPQLEGIKAYLLTLSAGVEPDPSDLMEASKCFQPLTEPQLKAIQTYLLCQIANGGSGACANLEGADSPLGSVTPDFIGQVYQQSDGTIWQAGSLLSSSWEIINGADLFTYNSGTGTAFASTLARYFSSNFWISGSNLTEITLPNVETVGGYFDIDTNTALATLDITGLRTVSSGLYLSDNDLLTEYDISSLETVGTEMVIQNNAAITSIDASSIVTVTGALGTIDNNTLLESIDLTSLVTVTGSVGIINNPALDTITVPAWLPTNGTNLTFTGNALLEATVDQILARCVANAAYISGTVDLSGGTNAPPSVTGDADVLILQGRGCTVNHN